MHHHYRDIRDRIAQPPVWWDENAVPRYCPFGPREVANIYAIECALVEIACQNCGSRFLVAWSRGAHILLPVQPYVIVSEKFDPVTFHYGDPPNAGCCASGPTMNSEPLRVVECWQRDSRHEWERDHSREGSIAGGDPIGGGDEFLGGGDGEC